GTKLNPIKTQHNREIRPRENHRTRLSYIYISVEDSREFPSCGDEITQSNSRRTSGFTVFYGEIEDEEEEGSRN
ncbi:BnaA05g18170D, partial [Brassica napus]